MSKTIIQISFFFIGIVSTVLGVKAMLQHPPIFFKTWFVTLVSLSILFICSILVGFLIKYLLKSNWHTLTFISIIMTLNMLPYYLTEYKYAYTINIPDNFVGRVKLFISRDNKNHFSINEYGIGYISNKTFKKGFRPTVLQKGVDITKQIGGMGRRIHPLNYHERYLLDYCTFNVPGAARNGEILEFSQLLIKNAIDTSRLRLK